MVGVPRLPMPLPKASGQWERMNLLPYERDTGSGQLRPAVPQVIQDVLSGLAAPGNALRGGYNQVPVLPDGSVGRFDPRMMTDAANLAGTIGVSGMSVPKLPNTLGMFGGEMAKTADRAALATAKQMAEQGASRDTIWDATGWFKGTDGKWRFEIDDSGARLSGSRAGSAEEVLPHGGLYDAYPNMRDMYVQVDDYSTTPRGQYTPHESREHLDMFDIDEMASVNATSPDLQRQVLLHELQHAVQRREGFARGGNMSVGRELSAEPLMGDIQGLQDYISSARRSVERSGAIGPFEQSQLRSIAEAEQELAALKARVSGKPETAFDAYQRISGEVEARNVETRRDLTPEQRRAKAPWLTQDVPDDRQIVRF